MLLPKTSPVYKPNPRLGTYETASILEDTVGRNQKKHLMDWSAKEKDVYRFWYKLDRLDLFQTREPIRVENRVEEVSEEKTPFEFLSKVRTQSEYPVFRLFINVGCFIQVVATLCYGGYQLLDGPYDNLLYVFAVVACTVMLVFVFIALRQGGLLLVDVADMLIEQGRRKFNR